MAGYPKPHAFAVTLADARLAKEEEAKNVDVNSLDKAIKQPPDQDAIAKALVFETNLV